MGTFVGVEKEGEELGTNLDHMGEGSTEFINDGVRKLFRHTKARNARGALGGLSTEYGSFVSTDQ